MFDSDNRWVLFSSLMPCEELEETYAPSSVTARKDDAPPAIQAAVTNVAG
jgi:hypothetical protein